MTKVPRQAEVSMSGDRRSSAGELARKDSWSPSLTAAAEAYELGPKAKALLRGRQINAEDLRAAGGAYSLQEVIELLGISKQAIAKRLGENALLAVPGPNGQRYYPAAQFGRDGVTPGLKKVLEALPSESAWFRLNFLVHPNAYLNGRTPLDVLPEKGAIESVVEAARRVGEQGA